MADPLKIVEEIFAERRRQVEVENYPPAHDDLHDLAELGRMGAAYALAASAAACGGTANDLGRALDIASASLLTPPGFALKRDKPVREKLVIAAALLVAEIERLDRLAEETRR